MTEPENAPTVSSLLVDGGETAASPGARATERLLKEIERGYVCPVDAGPAWLAAMGAGVDMALIEDALHLSPAERLRGHQRALDALLALKSGSATHDSTR